MRCADCDDLTTAGNTGLNAAWAVFDHQAVFGIIAKLSCSKDEC